MSIDNSIKVQIHENLCNCLHTMFINKNNAYGDSFHDIFVEEGMASLRVRLGDKLNRFKTLSKKDLQVLDNESIRDTLLDLANYALMAVIELDMMDEGEENNG